MTTMKEYDGEANLVGAIIRRSIDDYLVYVKNRKTITSEQIHYGKDAKRFLFKVPYLEAFIDSFGIQNTINADGVRRHVKGEANAKQMGM